ncbi:MAG TPA: hypothetical protein VKR06_24090 [Ktedonosporobacter sp.]|nr:hypothetical protein [Ktedonosporobacter sp.]
MIRRHKREDKEGNHGRPPTPDQTGALELAAAWGTNVATMPIVARVIGLDTTIGKRTPDRHQNGCRFRSISRIRERAVSSPHRSVDRA